jgi:pantetheine-phosphate adenylyltransferase
MPKKIHVSTRRTQTIYWDFKDEPKVTVITYEGLTIDLCKKDSADFILSGLRNPADFEFEKPSRIPTGHLSK